MDYKQRQQTTARRTSAADAPPIPVEDRITILEQRVTALEEALAKEASKAGGDKPANYIPAGAIKCKSSAAAWRK